MNFLGMGPAELLLIMALALVVFGPEQLPQLARQLGRVVADVRRLSAEATSELHRSLQDDATPPPPEPRPRLRPPADQDRPSGSTDDLRPPY
jgi:Tat protein translocase TatB subunit